MKTPVQSTPPARSGPIKTAEPRGVPSAVRTLRGSMRTHLVFLRFSTISLTTAAIDNLVFYYVYHATGTILGAQIAARTVSITFNYQFVRRTVFFSDRGHHTLLPRYLTLAALNALLSYAGIRVLSGFTPLSVIVSKIVAETGLFLSNFVIQRAYIFTRHSQVVNSPDARPGS